jgi:hypothetical protein
VKCWEIIADKSQQRPVGLGAVSQRLIPKAERSGLLMHTAITAKGSSYAQTKMLSAFLELERITDELALTTLLGDDGH